VPLLNSNTREIKCASRGVKGQAGGKEVENFPTMVNVVGGANFKKRKTTTKGRGSFEEMQNIEGIATRTWSIKGSKKNLWTGKEKMQDCGKKNSCWKTVGSRNRREC